MLLHEFPACFRFLSFRLEWVAEVLLARGCLGRKEPCKVGTEPRLPGRHLADFSELASLGKLVASKFVYGKIGPSSVPKPASSVCRNRPEVVLAPNLKHQKRCETPKFNDGVVTNHLRELGGGLP
jgi:hypothetical protein